MGSERLPSGGNKRINFGANGVSWCHNLPVNLTGGTAATFYAIGADGNGLYIPGGMMGPNGDMEIDFMFSMTNNANAKTPEILLGNIAAAFAGLTALFNPAITSQASFMGKIVLSNRNSESVQIQNPRGAVVFGQTTTAIPAALAIDTSRDMILRARGTLANGADSLQIERVAVRTIYRD